MKHNPFYRLFHLQRRNLLFGKLILFLVVFGASLTLKAQYDEVVWKVKTNGEPDLIKFFPSGDRFINNNNEFLQIRKTIDGSQIGNDIGPIPVEKGPLVTYIYDFDINQEENRIIVCSGSPCKVFLISIDSSKIVKTYTSKDSFQFVGVIGCRFSKDGKKIYCLTQYSYALTSGKIYVFDVESGVIEDSVTAFENSRYLDISEDGKYIAATQLTAPGSIGVWETSSLKPVYSFNTGDYNYLEVNGFKFLKNNKLSCYSDGKLFIADYLQKKIDTTLDFKYGTNGYDISYDNTLFAYFISDLSLYSLMNNNHIYSYKEGTAFPIFHKSNKYIIGYSASVIKLLGVKTTDIYENDSLVESFAVTPNPTGNSLNIEFTLKNGYFLNLSIINELGTNIKSLSEGHYAEGSHNLNINTADIPTGVYFFRLQGKNLNESHKIIISH